MHSEWGVRIIDIRIKITTDYFRVLVCFFLRFQISISFRI